MPGTSVEGRLWDFVYRWSTCHSVVEAVLGAATLGTNFNHVPSYSPWMCSDRQKKSTILISGRVLHTDVSLLVGFGCRRDPLVGKAMCPARSQGVSS